MVKGQFSFIVRRSRLNSFTKCDEKGVLEKVNEELTQNTSLQIVGLASVTVSR